MQFRWLVALIFLSSATLASAENGARLSPDDFDLTTVQGVPDGIEEIEDRAPRLKALLERFDVVSVSRTESSEPGGIWQQVTLGLNSRREVVLRKVVRLSNESRDETLTWELTGEAIWQRQEIDNSLPAFSGSDVAVGHQLVDALNMSPSTDEGAMSPVTLQHKLSAGATCAWTGIGWGGTVGSMINNCIPVATQLRYRTLASPLFDATAFRHAVASCAFSAVSVTATAVLGAAFCGAAVEKEKISHYYFSGIGATEEHLTFASFSLCFHRFSTSSWDHAFCVPAIKGTEVSVAPPSGGFLQTNKFNDFNLSDDMRYMRVGYNVPWVAITCRRDGSFAADAYRTYYFFRSNYVDLGSFFPNLASWKNCIFNTNVDGT